MSKTYELCLDESWDDDIWPEIITVSKPFNSESSKQYRMSNNAYAQITLYDDNIIGQCHCSKCHKIIDQFYNYCCYCGAKIIGKQLTNR